MIFHAEGMLDFLFDLLFPRRSLRGEEGKLLTEQENADMTLSPALFHEHELRERGIDHLDRLLAAGRYKSAPLLKSAVGAFKYKGMTGLGEAFGKRMTSAVKEMFPRTGGFPVLCAVPLHWTREFSRGFNQAEILARHISECEGWTLEHLLRRTHPTGHQAWRTRAQRLSAVEGAFRYVGPQIAPPHVILVDDLCTTGSTLSACAMALKAAGTQHIDAIVLAYG